MFLYIYPVVHFFGLFVWLFSSSLTSQDVCKTLYYNSCYFTLLFFFCLFQKDQIPLAPSANDVVNCVSKGKSQVSFCYSFFCVNITRFFVILQCKYLIGNGLFVLIVRKPLRFYALHNWHTDTLIQTNQHNRLFSDILATDCLLINFHYNMEIYFSFNFLFLFSFFIFYFLLQWYFALFLVFRMQLYFFCFKFICLTIYFPMYSHWGMIYIYISYNHQT